MAVSVKLMSLTVGTLGVISFIFGIVAENKKVSICNLCKQAYRFSSYSLYNIHIYSFKTVARKIQY